MRSQEKAILHQMSVDTMKTFLLYVCLLRAGVYLMVADETHRLCARPG